jgi:hypothetical protein
MIVLCVEKAYSVGQKKEFCVSEKGVLCVENRISCVGNEAFFTSLYAIQSLKWSEKVLRTILCPDTN